MMIIGKFTRYEDARDETYRGVIKTMSIFSDTITIARGGRRNGADYRVLGQLGEEEIEIGAGWTRKNGQGGEYIEIMIDDPALPAPLRADLVRARHDDDSFDLWWTRPDPQERQSA